MPFTVFEFKDLAKCDGPVAISQNESSLRNMSIDKAPRLTIRQGPRLTIRRVIWILPSDTDAVFVNPINISTNIETAILCVYHSQRQKVLRAFHKHAKLSQLSQFNVLL